MAIARRFVSHANAVMTIAKRFALHANPITSRVIKL